MKEETLKKVKDTLNTLELEMSIGLAIAENEEDDSIVCYLRYKKDLKKIPKEIDGVPIKAYYVGEIRAAS